MLLIKKIQYGIPPSLDGFILGGCHVCCCGEEHGLDNMHEVKIKGEAKKICEECITAIKGFA